MGKNASGPVYPISALREVVLHTQRLSTANNASPAPTADNMVELVKALGYVQVDTLYVVNRAHHLTLWARFGSYDIDDFHELIYAPRRSRLYEGWGHAASIIPLEHYRYHRWRTDPEISFNPGFREWVKKKNNRVLADEVLARIRAEGGQRVGAFAYDGPKKGEWYDWKPPKMALEALFAWGDLMVADRVNFQRVYDVRERVLPEWVDTTPVDPDEARSFLLEQAAKALGVFEARNLTFYAYMRAAPARSLVRTLVDDGLLVEVRGETTAGVRKWLVHRDNLPLLQRAADGDLKAERITFLSPFDSLFWSGGRDRLLWGFNQLLECYKPEAERVYGYFSLPILYKDRLAGRFDPKLDRKSAILQIKALYLEPGVEPDEALAAGIASVMRDFMAWHGAQDLVIERSEPSGFGEKVLRAI